MDDDWTAHKPVKKRGQGKGPQIAEHEAVDSYSKNSLVQEVIEHFPASLENRHLPMLKLVGSLMGGKGLDDETIIEVGTRWLRHFEGQYGLTFERALAELHKCLEFTRNNEKFVPFARSIEGVELSPRERFVIECVAETRDEELFLEVVLKEWRLDREKDVITTRRISNVGDAFEESIRLERVGSRKGLRKASPTTT